MGLLNKYINKRIQKYADIERGRALVESFYSEGITQNIKQQQETEELKYKKMEIDDLKLRIRVLEDQMKEHRDNGHISMSDVRGFSDVQCNKIPSRKQ